MRKISFQKDIGVDALYQLITSHVVHGFYYTILSRNTFGLLTGADLSIELVDMRDQGLGYVWYSYSNFIYIVTDDRLKDNELIYLKEEDVSNLLRHRKIERLVKLSS